MVSPFACRIGPCGRSRRRAPVCADPAGPVPRGEERLGRDRGGHRGDAVL